MKFRKVLFVSFVSILTALLFLGLFFLVKNPSKLDFPDVFVGIDAAYDDVKGIERFVDEVKSYTNFFVIGSLGIAWNTTKIDEVCQYIYDCGLYFLVYTHPTTDFPQAKWIEDARQRWRDRFFGLMAYDEPGGRQIDNDKPYMLVEQADNNTDAANKYVWILDEHLKHFRYYFLYVGDFRLFTSDYALYWFDYRGGYDVVLAEFGWNHSRQLNVALCRGAATVQNKDWGVMITWTYNNPPYIESGEELYNDMILAYNNGAKYIVVFDTNKNYTQGVLKEEHLEALKKFWDYIMHNPRTSYALTDRVAYVLPKDYGYGFRGPNDNVWGLWEANELSNRIWNDIIICLENYTIRMDIIYEDAIDYNSTSRYSELIFWNGTFCALP